MALIGRHFYFASLARDFFFGGDADGVYYSILRLVWSSTCTPSWLQTHGNPPASSTYMEANSHTHKIKKKKTNKKPHECWDHKHASVCVPVPSLHL